MRGQEPFHALAKVVRIVDPAHGRKFSLHLLVVQLGKGSRSEAALKVSVKLLGGDVGVGMVTTKRRPPGHHSKTPIIRDSHSSRRAGGRYQNVSPKYWSSEAHTGRLSPK